MVGKAKGQQSALAEAEQALWRWRKTLLLTKSSPTNQKEDPDGEKFGATSVGDSLESPSVRVNHIKDGIEKKLTGKCDRLAPTKNDSDLVKRNSEELPVRCAKPSNATEYCDNNARNRSNTQVSIKYLIEC